MSVNMLTETKVFGGYHRRYSHYATTLNCEMIFAVFIPTVNIKNNGYPAVYWLSGLTCTDENFMQKSGACRTAAQLGLILIAPDTSPRGKDIPDDEEGAYDFGLGAGFYLNATEKPWNKNYHMYDYVTKELPATIASLGLTIDTEKTSISGHSMGGHGALIIALRDTLGIYKSVSAFSPICNPCNCPWGQKAFAKYLGGNQELWYKYDTCELIKSSDFNKIPTMIEQGDKDKFLEKQLHINTLEQVANSNNYDITINIQSGYDHSYYFISSFIEKHLYFHYKYLEG